MRYSQNWLMSFCYLNLVLPQDVWWRLLTNALRESKANRIMFVLLISFLECRIMLVMIVLNCIVFLLGFNLFLWSTKIIVDYVFIACSDRSAKQKRNRCKHGLSHISKQRGFGQDRSCSSAMLRRNTEIKGEEDNLTAAPTKHNVFALVIM